MIPTKWKTVLLIAYISYLVASIYIVYYNKTYKNESNFYLGTLFIVFLVIPHVFMFIPLYKFHEKTSGLGEMMNLLS